MFSGVIKILARIRAIAKIRIKNRVRARKILRILFMIKYLS